MINPKKMREEILRQRPYIGKQISLELIKFALADLQENIVKRFAFSEEEIIEWITVNFPKLESSTLTKDVEKIINAAVDSNIMRMVPVDIDDAEEVEMMYYIDGQPSFESMYSTPEISYYSNIAKSTKRE